MHGLSEQILFTGNGNLEEKHDMAKWDQAGDQ